MIHRQPLLIAWKLFLLTILGIFLALVASCLLHFPDLPDTTALISYSLNATLAVFCIPLGVLIGWRRAGSNTMRALTLILVVMPMPWLIVASPNEQLRDVVVKTMPIIASFVYTAFLYFALQFPAASAFIKQPKVRMMFRAFVVLFVGVCAATVTSDFTLHKRQLISLFIAIAVLASLIALWRAWLTAAGTERQRIGWVALCMGGIFTTLAVYVASKALGNSVVGSNWANLLDAIQLACIVALAYAMMRYRLFDVGFAINRTLVFSVTSILLILVFFLIERAVHGLLHFEDSGKSAWVDGSIAFALFFSFNRLHHRVDHLVERLLFGAWHRNAKALHHFVEKSSHYTDASDLQVALGAELARFTGGAGYAFYRNDGQGRFVRVGATLAGAPATFGVNEDLAVSLRASHHSLDVSATNWAHGGEIAVPTLQGAKLDGMVILGRKVSGDNYRPDEIAALSFAVAQVGLILFALSADALERQNRELAQLANDHETKLASALRELDTLRRFLTVPGISVAVAPTAR